MNATDVHGAAAAGLRIFPFAALDVRRPQRMIERSLMTYRRSWPVIVSGFFEPVFFLISARVGMGKLIGEVEIGGRTVEYALFVAPALMAAAAMNGAISDSTFNVFAKLKFSKTYTTVLATPMSPADVAIGEIGWAVCRGALYAVAFYAVLVAMGLAGSAWMALSIVVAIVIGAAFAAVGMAATTYMRTWADFEYVTMITMPMLLFSGTFYPASSYGSLSWIVQLSPLYHGVALMRMASFGVVEWPALAHLAVLLAMFVVGIAVATRRVAGLLIT